MADSAHFPRLAIRSSDAIDSSRIVAPRHSFTVRVTHWMNVLSFAGLLTSGIAILLAHPRLYWGETGSVGTPSLIDLPLPFMLTGQSGWGRSLHFLSAWATVMTGAIYIVSCLFSGHFRKDFLPSESPPVYNSLQRFAYATVVFFLFPMAIWTGLAMSPAITSVYPALVTTLGGQQSARTIHFFVAAFLVVFVLVHIAMVARDGFVKNMRAMIVGHSKEATTDGKEIA
jgi:thiosulfate reductase cytochrome b subunit